MQFVAHGGTLHHTWLVDQRPKAKEKRQATLIAVNEQGQQWYCFMIDVRHYCNLF